MARTRVALLAALLMVATFPLGASAQVGTYTVEMGWQSEPALEGVPNAAYLEVRETASGTPVDGLAKTLRIQVSFGGAQTFEPAIRARADTPGAYVGDIVPTRVGDQIHLSGTINEVKVDERFDRTSVASIRSPRQRVSSPPIRSAAVRAPPASCGRWAMASTRRDGSPCWAQCLPRLRSCFPRSACDARGADRGCGAPSRAEVMFRRRCGADEEPGLHFALAFDGDAPARLQHVVLLQ